MSQQIDARKYWQTKKVANRTVGVSTPSRKMSKADIMNRLNTCDALNQALKTHPEEILPWIARYQPGSVPSKLAAPSFRNKDPLTTSQAIKMQSSLSFLIKKREEQEKKAAPMNEGKKLILNALDECRVPASCYNIKAICRMNVLQEFQLPDLDSTTLFIHSLPGISHYYNEIFKIVKALYLQLVKTNSIKRTQVQISFTTKTSGRFDIVVSTLQPSEVPKLPSDYEDIIADISFGNLLGVLPYLKDLFPVNEEEEAIKGELINNANNFVKMFSISSAEMKRQDINNAAVMKQLTNKALGNIRTICTLNQEKFKYGTIDPLMDMLTAEAPMIQRGGNFVGIQTPEDLKGKMKGEVDTAFPSLARGNVNLAVAGSGTTTTASQPSIPGGGGMVFRTPGFGKKPQPSQLSNIAESAKSAPTGKSVEEMPELEDDPSAVPAQAQKGIQLSPADVDSIKMRASINADVAKAISIWMSSKDKMEWAMITPMTPKVKAGLAIKKGLKWTTYGPAEQMPNSVSLDDTCIFVTKDANNAYTWKLSDLLITDTGDDFW